ncbi:glycosyltransferase family 8 protein [Enterococcus casseliflavus]|uniref:glycosyltransferase family 8 protein n=1 Tax=Enterococcus casseliflavus TaxID=37734 RepID=UPI0039900CDE
MNPIKIVFITDENYFKNMVIAIESILVNTKSVVEFYIILDDDLNEQFIQYKNYFLEKFKFSSFNILDTANITKKNNFKAKAHVSKAAFIKIYLPNLLQSLDKVIYLDSDLILLDDIEKLWDLDIQDFKIGAVWNPDYKDDNKYMEIPANTETFNSGVMILNLDKMRKDNSSEKLFDFLVKKNHLTRLNDQAAFNAIFYNDWMELPIEWNMQYKFFTEKASLYSKKKDEIVYALKNVSIVHFTSNSKPWQFRNTHPYKKVYLTYYRELFGKILYKDLSINSFLKKIKEQLTLVYVKILNRM